MKRTIAQYIRMKKKLQVSFYMRNKKRETQILEKILFKKKEDKSLFV